MRTALTIAISVALLVASGSQTDPKALLVEGKLQIDLGNYEAAFRALQGVLEDASATQAERGEALVRLGAAQRAVGDAAGSIESFRRAMREHGDEQETVRLLVLAVSGVVPARARWEAIWKSIRLVETTTGDGELVPIIVWPGFNEKTTQEPGPSLEPSEGMTLDVTNADLQEVLRAFADVTQMNIVLHPGISGAVSAGLFDVPWQRALNRVLRANGLAYRIDGNIIEIGLPGEVVEVQPANGERYSGELISLDFTDADLHDVMRLFSDILGRPIVLAHDIEARNSIKLTEVPWDRAFELILNLYRLEAVPRGNAIAVGRDGFGRISIQRDELIEMKQFPDPGHAPGPELLDPKCRRCAPALYPEAALVSGVEGTVELGFTIDERGMVEAVRNEQSGGSLLDDAVEAALSHWRFEAASVRGEPVPVRWRVRQRFSLKGSGSRRHGRL